MSYFLKYFAARSAYDALRAHSRGPHLDYLPADLAPIVVENGAAVLWLRPNSYPVLGEVCGRGHRGIQVVVARPNGETTQVWVRPEFLVTR